MAADGAIADAAGLAVQFDGASPEPRAEARRGVHLRNAACHRKEQGERVLGDGAGADERFRTDCDPVSA